ncbi:MAG: 4-hydroxy-tetrahydrodipicolinate synthase [Thermotogota bacterium]|nr:4-hydroxy-tetrahydrodipicolinate synthase [Thermotogota bacterium]MDK2864532.1 4-hydroxy-tetrahydrodipicolinate synthase [Thermotogota bacterium]HCZ06200.1 4-hydroxy-tetrahydrodipicolinate synthase [Thermotogota bacterium]
MFKGVATALITPFSEGAVDYKSFEKFIQWQIEKGVDALLVLGTTGEAPSISEEERKELVSFAVKLVNGRVPLIVGTGTNSTEKTLKMTLQAQDLGADGALIVTPYYNKPVQEGLYQHYAYIAKRVEIPIIIYNVPSRTGVNILPETVVRLAADFKNIVGVKEASGNMAQIDLLLLKLKGVRDDFLVWSGNDDQAFHLMCSGGHGVISVLSNVVPDLTAMMCKKTLEGNLEEARELHLKLFPLMKALFVETNPIPVKFGVSLLGMCKNELRLPLVPASEKTRELVESTMKELGVLS